MSVGAAMRRGGYTLPPLTDPSAIADLAVWMKAADVALADDAAVASWTGALGHVFAQATGTKQPIYKTTAFNGGPCVRCDGTDDSLAVTSTVLQTVSRTVVIACRSGLSDLTSNAGLFSWNGTLGYAMATTSERMRTVYQDATPSTVVITSGTGSAEFADTNPMVLTYGTGVSGADVRTLQRKNAATKTDSTSSAGATAPSGSTLRIATTLDAGNFFNGDFAEILVWTRLLTADEYLSVERYLGTKYGIIVA